MAKDTPTPKTGGTDYGHGGSSDFQQANEPGPAGDPGFGSDRAAATREAEQALAEWEKQNP